MTDHIDPPSNEPEGLYDKYRVFREPREHNGDGHPVPLFGPYQVRSERVGPRGSTVSFDDPLEEVQEFVFVLKPDSDPHARVAIATYAYSVMQENPELTEDLLLILNQMGA